MSEGAANRGLIDRSSEKERNVERKKQNAGMAVMMVLGLAATSVASEWVSRYDGPGV
jgi:hypothetical protein